MDKGQGYRTRESRWRWLGSCSLLPHLRGCSVGISPGYDECSLPQDGAGFWKQAASLEGIPVRCCEVSRLGMTACDSVGRQGPFLESKGRITLGLWKFRLLGVFILALM